MVGSLGIRWPNELGGVLCKRLRAGQESSIGIASWFTTGLGKPPSRRR